MTEKPPRKSLPRTGVAKPAANHSDADETPTVTDAVLSDSVAAGQDSPTLTVMTGEHVGAVLAIGAEEIVVGRSLDAQLVLSDTSLSRRHARFFRVDDRFFVQDLGSTNGTHVRGEPIGCATRLRHRDQVRLGADTVIQFGILTAGEAAAAAALYESMVRDDTTGVHNRLYFERRLASEGAMARSRAASLAVLLLDIDHFKRINDAHGHVVGDSVLRVVATSVQRLLRPGDALARFGGDELAVICRETSFRNARILAERVRGSVAKLEFSAAGNEFHVTVSVGVAVAVGRELDCGDLVRAADRAMYRAKQDGGDSVR